MVRVLYQWVHTSSKKGFKIDKIVSGTARFLLLNEIKDWMKKGKKKIGLFGKYE